jgi:hypothetical protein
MDLAQPFTRFVDDEDNRELVEEVSKEELKEVLHNFQKEKIPRPDDSTIELFLGFYEILS